jgi:hypothetical protein
MRMAASWFGSAAGIHRMQGCGAMFAPDGELPSDRPDHVKENYPML